MELESDLLLCKNWIEAKSKDWSDSNLLLSLKNTQIQIYLFAAVHNYTCMQIDIQLQKLFLGRCWSVEIWTARET